MTNSADEMTEHLLIDAGISKGMRVLDIGCGRGDLSLLLAGMVGPQGQVLGVDRDENALVLARERAQEAKLSQVAFSIADLSPLSIDQGPFNAIVGRRVLMYLPDPGHVIAALSGLLAAGGVMVFQEHDATMPPGCVVPMPLHKQASKWVWATVEREGGNTHLGFNLWNLLTGSGLVVEKIRAEGLVQTPDTPYPIANIVRAALPRIVYHGIATKEEIDISTLERRLAEESDKSNATYISEMVFCVWARKPA